MLLFPRYKRNLPATDCAYIVVKAKTVSYNVNMSLNVMIKLRSYRGEGEDSYNVNMSLNK